MAIWDYKCNLCGIEYEMDSLCSFIQCGCGGVMERVWSTPVISFKGKGFYCNDKGSK